MKNRICAVLVGMLLSPLAFADSVVQQAQQALKDQGYYYGQVNGQKDADTTAAIRRFQIRNGLQVTGELNEETLRALNSAASAPQTATPPPQVGDSRQAGPRPATPLISPAPGVRSDVAPPPPGAVFSNTPFQTAPPELQRRVIIGAQTLLRRRGFYKGQIDGVAGPDFEFALRAYQSGTGLAATGRLDVETLGTLGLLPGQPGPGIRFAPKRRFPSQFDLPPVRGEWIRERERESDEDEEND